ncbi:Mobile element protein [Richelia intracellularis]|nr:Mobile element protein [Richelia intracellularis]
MFYYPSTSSNTCLSSTPRLTKRVAPKRFNVLGAVNAVTKEIITIINETYINSDSLCELLFKLAALHKCGIN